MKERIRVVPGVFFQIKFGDINTFRQSYEWERRRRNQGAEPRERSRDENRKGRKGGSQGGKFLIHQKTEERTCYQMCKRNLEICVVHFHNDIKWGNACTELRGMYLQCLAHKS